MSLLKYIIKPFVWHLNIMHFFAKFFSTSILSRLVVCQILYFLSKRVLGNLLRDSTIEFISCTGYGHLGFCLLILPMCHLLTCASCSTKLWSYVMLWTVQLKRNICLRNNHHHLSATSLHLIYFRLSWLPWMALQYVVFGPQSFVKVYKHTINLTRSAYDWLNTLCWFLSFALFVHQGESPFIISLFLLRSFPYSQASIWFGRYISYC